MPGVDGAAPALRRYRAFGFHCGEYETTGAVCQERESSLHVPRTHGNYEFHFPCRGQISSSCLRYQGKQVFLSFALLTWHGTSLHMQEALLSPRALSACQISNPLPSTTVKQLIKAGHMQLKSKVRGNLNIWSHNQLPWLYPAGNKMTTDGGMASLHLVISSSTPSSSSANYSHVM